MKRPLTILKASTFLFIGILLGKCTGFFRESLLASNFGATKEADVVVLLLTVPDFLVGLLVGGGLSAVLIPEFKRLDPARSQAFFIQAFIFTISTFSCVTWLLIQYIDYWLFMLVPGFNHEKIKLISALLAKVLWVIPLTTAAGVTTAYMQANDKFGVAALGTFIINIFIIIGLIISPSLSKIGNLINFVILGAAIRLLSQVIVIPKCKPEFTVSMRMQDIYGIMIRYFEAIASLSLLVVIPVIARSVISYQSDGDVAIFNYSIKLSDFLHSACITLLSVALFPKISELSKDSCKNKRYHLFIKNSMFAVTLIACSTTFCAITFCFPIAKVIHGWGSMSDQGLVDIAHMAIFTFLALPFQGISSLLISIFNAHRNTKVPLWTNFAGLLFFCCLALLLKKHYGVNGVLISLILANIFIAALQILLLDRFYQLNIKRFFKSKDFFLCLLITIIVCIVSRVVIIHLYMHEIEKLLLAGLTFVCEIIMVLFAIKQYREKIIYKVKGMLH